MEDINPIFEEFAGAFAGEVEYPDDVAFPEKLDRGRLDYSLESLHVVDAYLDYLYEHNQGIGEEEWKKTVMRGGAYVGEVVRRNARETWMWIDYNDYMPQNPDLQQMIPDRTAATCAFLCREDGSMWMPLNKVARFIEEGPEQNTHYAASVECGG
ncbi:MAG TPA: hypothetical protein VGQ99_08830 [Tepidisphaeraceae bacterium]|jgi:hypothetical protein|nr:hypothetical protein [Tepidisphaeraceae bacterium]